MSRRLRFRGRSSDAALALGWHHAAELLRAGASLVDTLDAVAATEPHDRGRRFWQRLARTVERGVPLSSALADAERRVPVEHRARVRSGENDGALAAAFDDLEAALLQSRQHRLRMNRATAYPAIATFVLALAVGFLLTRIVPPLSASVGRDAFDWHAWPLVWLSERLTPLPITSAVLLGTLAFLCRRRVGWGAEARVARRLDLARVAGSVSRLHRSGVPLDRALDIALDGCRSMTLADDLRRARERLVAGGSLTTALADARSVPPMFLRFVAAGESSGALDAALGRAARHLEDEALRALAERETLAGPIVLCLVGALLCWVVISILLPVYGLALGAGIS